MTEARIGSLPWFCGVWWLLLSYQCSGAARLFVCMGLGYYLGWWMLLASEHCLRMAVACAIEAGAKP